MTAPRLPRSLPPRVVVEAPSPAVDRDRFAAKASIGEPLPFSVDAYADGHDVVAVDAVIIGPDEAETVVELSPTGNDRFLGRHRFGETGRYRWTARAWIDDWATWVMDTTKKVDAGLDVSVELQMGAAQLQAAAGDAPSGVAKRLKAAAKQLESGSHEPWLHDVELHALMRAHADHQPIATLGYDVPLLVERERARFSAWYEFFPRSVVGGPDAESRLPGTLADAVDRLDHIAGLGFDIVYLPPIHPIGITARKGPNNSTVSTPDDPGSPWAIGGPEGGHTAVHPELGTVEDVETLAKEAEARGMELALDIAFQCSPDHPWVAEHPEWFVHRPDGTIQYAENPPKKYQDIYPLDFETSDWKGLWKALRDVVRFWCDRGVRIFRVDNPHTKAFAFWEWMIADIQQRYDGVIFLAEAFTRPKVMQRLAKLGFTQSYTYFPWRNWTGELREYLEETSHATVDWFRPNSWPNTPDILTEHLQHGGRPASMQRAVLAATLTASYGIYGPAFELVETEPRPGAEEYLDNEKYQYRVWNLDQPHSLAPLLRTLNTIRRDHPALQWDRTLHFHHVEADGILCYSKTWLDDEGQVVDRILTVVNLDPHQARSGVVDLDLDVLDLAETDEFTVDDLLGGGSYRWARRNYVHLDPRGLTAHVFAVRADARATDDGDLDTVATRGGA